MVRTFVALWPPPGAAERCAAAARDAMAGTAGQADSSTAAGVAPRRAARALSAGDLHLTLAFLGETDPAAMVPIGEALRGALSHDPLQAAVAADPIVLDRIGSFRGADVTWLAPSSPPPWLAAVARATRAALDAARIAYDRKPFVPHLTVARGWRAPGAPIEPLEIGGWRVALACSDPGAAIDGRRYRIVRALP